MFKRVKNGLAHPYLKPNPDYLKPNIPPTPPARVLYSLYCCSAETLSKYCCPTAVHSSYTAAVHRYRHTAHSFIVCSTMPCAAGSQCAAVPDHTPGPPNFTIHKCRVCGGYLHGLCGLQDPLDDNEMKRVCHGCVDSNKRNESSAGSAAGAASSKRPCPEGRGTGKAKQAASLGSLKPAGKSAGNRKARGAKTRDSDDDADPSAGNKTQAVDTPRPPPYTEVWPRCPTIFVRRRWPG